MSEEYKGYVTNPVYAPESTLVDLKMSCPNCDSGECEWHDISSGWGGYILTPFQEPKPYDTELMFKCPDCRKWGMKYLYKGKEVT